ncbi:putative gibberellin 20 [Diplodia seriata]|uniref:Putative gibberellin 20 n=1 Tax=Diplodia seriata TaxID=420778 RepID=A0A0G2EHP6_9PEZI|nr:putative gibberellin 20 [Diplodia seriata]
MMDWADLEALDISKIDDPAGLKELAEQVLRFINKNGFFYVTGHGFTDEEKIHNTLLLPLLRLFAHVLELPDTDHFVRRHRYSEPGLEYLRYMLYHPTAADHDVWARGHTDYNTLTFLFHQPVAGLQVLTPSGAWKHVRSPRDAIIVNIADALEFLSGGYLRSTVHRVVRPPADQLRAEGGDQGRLSLIYFARPEKNVVLKPVDSPLLRRIGVQGGGRSADEEFSQEVTAEGTQMLIKYVFAEWARARIAKDHRFRVGLVDQREKEIIAGVNEKYYD